MSTIVPAPDTGEPTQFTPEELAAMVGHLTPTSGTLGYTDNATHSLNAMVELVYVRIGNEVMAQALEKLETALSATQRSLDALATVQGLQNMIDVQSKGPIPFNFTAGTQTVTYMTSPTFTITATGTATAITIAGTTTVNTTVTKTTATATVSTTKLINSADSYMSAYFIIASAYYQPIDPFFSLQRPNNSALAFVTTSGVPITNTNQMDNAQFNLFMDYRDRLITSKGILSGLISALIPLTPTLPGGGTDSTTLLAKLRIVYDHFPVANPPSNTTFSAVRAWVLDGYTSHSSTATAKQGLIQQEITNAIIAGESLNSAQNSSVRRYMFIFEQYYQSATSIISSLNQLMSNIARKISG